MQYKFIKKLIKQRDKGIIKYHHDYIHNPIKRENVRMGLTDESKTRFGYASLFLKVKLFKQWVYNYVNFLRGK